MIQKIQTVLLIINSILLANFALEKINDVSESTCVIFAHEGESLPIDVRKSDCDLLIGEK